MKSVPAWTPAWIRRNPALLVEWLRLANAFSRWRAEGTHIALFALGVIIVLLLVASLWGHAAPAVKVLAEYWAMLALVAAVYGATSVSGRRKQLEESKSQSWLVATPIPPRSLLISQAIRALLPLFLLIVTVVAMPALIALMNASLATAAGTVAAAATGGLLSGGIVGWRTGRGSESSGVVPSRYVPQPRVRRAIIAADASALTRWPIVQVLAWSRPENSRYVLIAALLAVQGGSSAIAGLSVVAMYFVASYLVALLSAMITVGKSAAVWLRATPMTLVGFVWSVSRRALAHQLIAMSMAITCMLLLGAPLGMALQIAALWLGLFISISGFALVDHYRGHSPLVKIALSVATFAALATLLQMRAGAKT